MNKALIIPVVASIWVGALLSPLTWAGELLAYRAVTLVANENNDGDSFHVRLGNEERTIRLYFVDCPEISVATETGARRVRTQTRYFGLPDHSTTIAYGEQAAGFTEQQLAKPFTLYTSRASAPGRTSGGRIYGFVETAEGKDLATLLVQNGLARAYGVARRTPHNVHHAEMAARLADIESGSMLARCGIWKDTDPDRLVSQRAREREEAAGRPGDSELASSLIVADAFTIATGKMAADDPVGLARFRNEFVRRVEKSGARTDEQRNQVIHNMLNEIVVYNKSAFTTEYANFDDRTLASFMSDDQIEDMSEDVSLHTADQPVFRYVFRDITRMLRDKGNVAVNRKNILLFFRNNIAVYRSRYAQAKRSGVVD